MSVNAQAQIHAYVSNSYGGGAGFSLTTSAPYEYSPTSVVNALNAQDALWLLTCPSQPSLSPTGPQYFNNNPPPGQAPFGGDQCSAHPSSASFDVATTATLDPSYYGGYSTSGSFSSTDTGSLLGTPLSSSLTGSSLLSINALGFGAQVDNFVSDIFSKNLNIFQQAPSMNMHMLWTWYSEIPYISNSKQLISFSPQACDKNGQNCVGNARQQTTGGEYTTDIVIGDSSGDSTETKCSYPSYSYLSSVNVINFGSTYIPYLEVTGASATQPASQRLSPDPKIFPYISYTLSVPSLFSQTLQVPYYVFSPAQYMNPANQLDALPVSIGGQFYVSIQNGKSGNQLAMGTQESLPNWNPTSLKTTITNPTTGSSSGSGGVCHQTSLSEDLIATGGSGTYDPNNPPVDPLPGVGGYLNSLYCNFCRNSPGSNLCTQTEFYKYLVDCTGQTYITKKGDRGETVALGNLEPTPPYCQSFTTVQSALQSISNTVSIISLPTDYTYVLYRPGPNSYAIDVLRTIPNGRYDVGIPSVPEAPDSQIWEAEWQQYWQQVINAQNDNTYVSAQYSASISGFRPLNMTVDYLGDIFMTGTKTDSSGIIQPAIAEIPVSGASSVVQIVKTTSSPSQPGGTKDWPMPEIAVAPGGKYVYLANQTDGGYIYQYSVLTDTSGAISFSTPQPVSLAYQAQDSATGQSSMLNITYWLEHKGLYNQPLPFLGQFLSTYTPQPGLDLDSALYHHPVGIQDVNGYLYVLDNWAGSLDPAQETCTSFGQCKYNGVFFSILTMRIINSSGLNVPINPTLFNDVFSTKSSSCSLSFQSGTSASLTNCYPDSQSAPTCVPASSDQVTKCGAPVSTSCTIPPPAGSPSGTASTTGTSYLCTTPTSRSSTYTSLSVPTAFSSSIYPPYGWFISANVTATELQDLTSLGIGSSIYAVGSGSTDGTTFTYGTANFCASSVCDFNPQNLKASGYTGTFAPMGPQITALNMSNTLVGGVVGQFFGAKSVARAISTSAALQTKWAPVYYNTGFSVGFNGSVSLLFTKDFFSPSPPFGYTLGTTNPNNYNALILSAFGPQNYTSFFGGDPLATCYADDPAVVSATSCKSLPLVAQMLSPVYNMPDPLKFVENLGGSQALAFPGSIASSYSYQAPSGSALTNCEQAIAQGTVCQQGTSISGTASSAQASVSSPLPISSLLPLQQSATITISGQVLVPYQYTSDTQQTWTNFQPGTCQVIVKTINSQHVPTITTTTKTNQAIPSGGPPIAPPAETSATHYTYGTSPIFTNTIVVPIEGGGTYLQDLLGKYYQQNLSDFGTMLSPQLAYNINSNRQITDTLVNITTNNLHGASGGNQYILNSSHNSQYVINTYSQGSNPGYQTISSIPYAIAQNGLAAAVNVLSNTAPADPSSVNQNYLGANTVYGSISQGQTVVNLFNFYISMANSDLNSFYMSNTLLGGASGISYQALGYNRLTYVLRDRFNNTFSAPIDADIADPTQISLIINPTVDSVNANKTTLAISGTATYTINGQTQPVPPDSSIYVYYGKNINFASYNPLSDPLNAQLCAFTAAPSAQEIASKLSANCNIANPLASDAQAALAAQQTYHTSYNSIGDCAPAPQHLLDSSSYNCNINDQSAAKCPASPQGNPQYCVPQASDGSGICTSQLGLIGTATTDSNGAFSISTVACGIGSALIDSEYYGYPGPEPTTVVQTPLTLAFIPALTCTAGKCTQTTIVNNYYYSPTHTLQAVPIGIFELSYGDVGIAMLVLSLISVILLLVSKPNKAIYRRKRPIK
ncbi:MAG TPA: hypothetical protein VNF06_00720 [Candidatus Aquilonibacter sp.]|nr:hypothetical protein [Candidatus Aquilonibacter sp.]